MFGSGISQALIDLEGGTEDADGITENDAGDADVGANSLQNSPEILSAVFIGSEQYRIYRKSRWCSRRGTLSNYCL